MGMNGEIEIDMEKYGMTGTVTIRLPRFRRQKEMENAVSRMARMGSDGRSIEIPELNIGDVQIIQTLLYVDSAPFKNDFDVKAVYDYFDKLDDTRRGSAEEFWKEVEEAVEKVKTGDTHPLA